MSEVNVDPMIAYRQSMVEAAYKSQEDFDKTVLALSGGALGVSFTFLKEVVGKNPIEGHFFLLGAWGSWALAASCVLASYQLSHQALRRAIQQVDLGTIRAQKPGGVFARITAWLNLIGACAFVAGVILISVFAWSNMKSVPVASQSTHAKVHFHLAQATGVPPAHQRLGNGTSAVPAVPTVPRYQIPPAPPLMPPPPLGPVYAFPPEPRPPPRNPGFVPYGDLYPDQNNDALGRGMVYPVPPSGWVPLDPPPVPVGVWPPRR